MASGCAVAVQENTDIHPGDFCLPSWLVTDSNLPRPLGGSVDGLNSQLSDGGCRGTSQEIATEAFGRCERVVIDYYFSGEQVSDAVLVSEIEFKQGVETNTAVALWIVQSGSSGEAPLNRFEPRHVYLLSYLCSVLTKIVETGTPLERCTLQELEARGGSHPEGLWDDRAIVIIATEPIGDLFGGVRRSLSQHLPPPDPMLKGSDFGGNYSSLGIPTAPLQTSFSCAGGLSPVEASVQMLLLVILSCPMEQRLRLLVRAGTQWKSIVDAWCGQNPAEQVWTIVEGLFSPVTLAPAVAEQWQRAISDLTVRIELG
jgi:hypothetical protein